MVPLVLKLRVITGVALAALVAAAVMLLPTAWMAAFFHLFVLVAVYEWAKLAGVASRAGLVVYAAVISALLAALWLLPELWPAALIVAAGFWVAALGVAGFYPASARILGLTPVLLGAGVIAIAGAWLALVKLKTAPGDGAGLVIWLLAAVAAADIGAYFAGRRLGRRQLAPRVSPGKTWEGAMGGALATLAWGLGGAWYFAGPWPTWLAVAALVVLAAVAGDLFESALKRARGVKDSGALLPGHGGVLDRIDSVLAAAPVFALLVPGVA